MSTYFISENNFITWIIFEYEKPNIMAALILFYFILFYFILF
jgi:hypothetical protein